MTDFTGLNYKNLVMNFKNTIIEALKPWHPNGLNCVDKETFIKDNPNAESIFAKLDFNNDGYVTDQEFNSIKWMDNDNDGVISADENAYNKENAMKQALRLARRNIDKWFTTDIDRDGYRSNVENHLAMYKIGGQDHTKEHQLDASMTNEELAQKYGMIEANDDRFPLEGWMNVWTDYIKNEMQEQYGYEATEADMINVKKEMIKQLNTWLFKTGDNATQNAPLYQSLNNDSYTRLMTNKQTASCCGGNIIPPPATNSKGSCIPVFRSIEGTKETENALKELEIRANTEHMTEEDYKKALQQILPHNTAGEVKNRLAWAIYNEPQRARDIQKQIEEEQLEVAQKVKSGEMTQEEVDAIDWSIWARMSNEEYAQCHENYARIRNMSAADYRELLKPENKEARENFEKSSNMRVFQIVQYIDIVESVTGVNFDSPDWKIDADKFHEISLKVNDTHEDAKLLEGKTRADVPENRQKLLRFLEEKGWLYEQFQ